MIEELIRVLTVITAVGAGLMGGFFFAFSTSVMKALARLPPAQGMAAMQAINVTVINPVFLTAFFGTAMACILLTIFSLLGWQRPGSGFRLAGSLLYLFGAIGVTVQCNVPRNERLAVLDPASTEGTRSWTGYVTGWTAWNHVRTAASVAAAAALILALRHRT
jgi:uncharacterized membrane protein